MSERVVNSFGHPSAHVLPFQSVRRLDHGVLAGTVGWLAGAGLAAAALWHPLPGLGEVPAGGFINQMLDYPQLLVSGLSGGLLFPDAWADNPASGASSPWALHLRLLPAWIAGTVCGGWLAKRALMPQAMTSHIAGPQLHMETGSAEREAIRLSAEQRGGDEHPGFLRLHPLLNLPKRTWSRHLLICGSVGSGKTQIIYPIVRRIIRKKKKLFLLDVKGDYTSAIRRATLLSPWDDRSAYWDIARDVQTSAQAATFASSMIPSGQGANQFFATAAELILMGCVRTLQHRAPLRWGWEDLDFLLNLSANELAPLLAEHYAKAQPVVSGGEATAANVLSSLAAFTQTISQLAEAFGNGKRADGTERVRLSLTDWVRDDFDGCPAIIAQAGPDPGLTQRYLSAAINVLVPEIISGAMPDDVSETGRALFFVLDELATLGSNVNLAPLIDKGRSKGVCVIAGFQDLAQLAAIHGDHFANALPGMVGSLVVCQTQMGPTRDRLAKLFGDRRVALHHLQPGRPLSVSEAMQPVVHPHELTDRLGHHRCKRHPHGFGIRAIVSMGGDPLLLDWPGRPMSKRRRPFVPAPWTLPASERRASAVSVTGSVAAASPSGMPLGQVKAWAGEVRAQVAAQVPTLVGPIA